MNENLNKSPMEILKENFGGYLAAMVVYMLIGAVTNRDIDNILWNAFTAFVSALITVSNVSFLYQSIVNGKPDFVYMYDTLLVKEYQPKILAIILAQMLLNASVGLVSAVLASVPIIGVVVALLLSMVTLLFLPIWYLFMANKSYDTATYFKASAEIMFPNIIGYMGAVLLFVVAMVLAVVIMVMVPLIGIVLIVPVLVIGILVFEIYIAQFMIKIIPDSWYYGF